MIQCAGKSWTRLRRKAGPVAGREEMLERIRKALGYPLLGPGQPPQSEVSAPLGSTMPLILPNQLTEKFETEFEKVGGCGHRAASSDELDEILRATVANCGGSSLVLSRNPLLAQLSLQDKFRAWGMSVAVWPPGGMNSSFREQCFVAGLGITGVDFVLAETGSLVLSSATEGSQLTSLAPPIHIALYRRTQVVGTLEEVLEQLALTRIADAETPGRSIVFVTGTSRTADIEQILIRGVHGPREVHAILIEESCLL